MEITLPIIYFNWLKENTEGVIEENGVCLYGLNDLAERNEIYEAYKYMPSYYIIGDDSGDTVYVMEKNISSTAVYSVGMGDMDENNVVKISENFLEWVRNIAGFIEDETSLEDVCTIYLKDKPDEMADLLMIKKIFNPTVSIGDILQNIKTGREVMLVSRINKYKFQKIINRYEYLLKNLRVE
ncbi:MAG: SMI1/KNR4 family protein [Selenomonas sp.]|uniref:SMI1/KNR4 family protein n=1 Tax=Selenomonas sp. TaxID=2053611 RepID=UPI0025F7F191|nr:SMI1/KNR4 family protein [Selenomonas sp.]MCR5439202.1 SMI1/KNR4 family protein [Selenomonas sp.]